ncbi:helix-turn-helix domain-containing protein [Vibrio sp.]|nr:helix-turn-helix domain-containing protein [Vibrio sp.]
MNIIGKQLQDIRKEKRVTQEEMVARLQVLEMDISRSTYSKVEMGLRQVKDYEVLLFAKALQVKVELLFQGGE